MAGAYSGATCVNIWTSGFFMMDNSKSCDGCAMCCMVMGVKALDKPKGVWCTHCSSRKSCDDYEARPDECRNFYCGYITVEMLDERWKPSKSKIIMVEELGGRRVTAYVDPNRPDAWRKEPFYSTLKGWSQAALAQNRQVMVCVNDRTYIIFPDRDVDLGVVDADHHVISVLSGDGRSNDPVVVHKDDARIQEFLGQTWHKSV